MRVALLLLLPGVVWALGAPAAEGGGPLGGVMVSAFDEERRQYTSVFSRPDGSFRFEGLRQSRFNLRGRVGGRVDAWLDEIDTGSKDVAIEMEVATGEDLEEQRPATSGFAQLKFANIRDKLNFKMFWSSILT